MHMSPPNQRDEAMDTIIYHWIDPLEIGQFQLGLRENELLYFYFVSARVQHPRIERVADLLRVHSSQLVEGCFELLKGVVAAACVADWRFAHVVL